MKALWTGVPSNIPVRHVLGALYLVHCRQCLSDVVPISTTYLAHKSMLELNVRCTDANQVAIMAGRDILSLTMRSKSDHVDHLRVSTLRTGKLRTSINLHI